MKAKSQSISHHRLIRWIITASLILLAAYLHFAFWNLPSVEDLPQTYMIPSVRITDRNGRLLYEIIPQNGGRNTVLSIDTLPQCLKDATVAVEDKNFYTNPGIDPTGLKLGGAFLKQAFTAAATP